MDSFHLKMQLKILAGDEPVLGPGLVTLLTHIQTTGSLRRASKAMGMSYAKCWRILAHAENTFGKSLTKKTIGGPQGGSSCLTPLALNLMARYEAFSTQSAAAVQQLYETIFLSDPDLSKILAPTSTPKE
ncbi:hypothetical protein ABB02_01853 [Clostridiaceae bacterium JG1575]|nr:hypothetical protein ABB02_01853 [Clostridiaceae bacterium JG1575]